MKITRDVINDLWPLYLDGAASADSRALVEEFLREDPTWKQTLQESTRDQGRLPAPAPQPDREIEMLNRLKKRALTKRIFFFGALIASAQAFARIISDTSWDVSPKVFLWWVGIASAMWITWAVLAVRLRRMGP
jgi:hypothetical protein